MPHDIESHEVLIEANFDDSSSHDYVVIKLSGAYTTMTYCDRYEVLENSVKCYNLTTGEVVEYMQVNSVLDRTQAIL